MTKHVITRATGLVALTLASFGCGGKVGVARDIVSTPHSSDSKGTNVLEAARAAALQQPGEPYWPFRIAEHYVESDSSSKAEPALVRSLAIDPTYAPALSLLSKVYFEQRRHGEAIQLLTDAELMYSGAAFPPELLVGLALHYDASGETDRAREILERVQARAPIPRSAEPALAYVSLRGEPGASPSKLAEKALESDSDSAVNLNNFGVSRLMAGDPERAKKSFLEALEKDENLPGPYYNLAIVERFYLLDHEEAAKWFRVYWSKSHEDPDGLAELLLTGSDAAEKEAATRVASADRANGK
jgi:tetratricopeptide (TPR) repeat protein